MNAPAKKSVGSHCWQQEAWKVGPSYGSFAGLSRLSFSVLAFLVSGKQSLDSRTVSSTLALPMKRGVAGVSVPT